jgi:hypothetical protein
VACFASLASACGTSTHTSGPKSPPKPPTDAQPGPLALPAAERSLVARDPIVILSAADVPASLQVDGDLAEWAVFAQKQPSPLTPSFVAITTTADSVVLLGRIRNVPEQGLWLRLETEAPELPPIGMFERGGGISPLRCEVDEDSGIPPQFDPETCQQLTEQYDEVKKSFQATFVRQLHLTAQALSVRSDEQEQPIADAKYAPRTEPGAFTFEAVLPLKALPRVANVELSSLFVTPERADAPPPTEAAPDRVQSVVFARPIRFGKDSDALQCLLQSSSLNFPRNPRFSYQPGVPDRIYRAANSDGLTLGFGEGPLSSRQGGLGALELRSVHGGSPMLALFDQEKLVQCLSMGEVLGVVERGRGLHVIGYTEDTDESVGLQGAYFQVLEIAKDGTLHDDVFEGTENGFGYTSVGEEHAKNLTSFSISGMYQTGEGGSQQHQLTWRYDARMNHYGFRERKGRYVPPNEQGD